MHMLVMRDGTKLVSSRYHQRALKTLLR
jgi:hypothetical protein